MLVFDPNVRHARQHVVLTNLQHVLRDVGDEAFKDPSFSNSSVWNSKYPDKFLTNRDVQQVCLLDKPVTIAEMTKKHRDVGAR